MNKPAEGEQQSSSFDSEPAHHESASVMLIGAGPIGLELAIGLQSAGIDYIHVDARQIGHTISWFPRQAHFFSSPERISIAGVPLLTVDQSKATREEYLTYLLAVAQQFDLKIRAYERVVSIEPSHTGRANTGGQRFRVLSDSRRGRTEYDVDTVIVAMGDMHRPRELIHPGETKPIDGSDLPHVSSYFEEPHGYAGQNLVIVGGKNSAAEAALRCHRIGAHVTLVQRAPELSSSIKYWLKPELQWLIDAGAMQFFGGYAPTQIDPESVEIAPVDSELQPILDVDVMKRIPADFVLLMIGYTMDPTLLRSAGVELWGAGLTPKLNPKTMETNVPGLFVAGTAAAGTQMSFKLFIENCHAHVVRILRSLTGDDPKHVNPLAYTRLDEHPLDPES